MNQIIKANSVLALRHRLFIAAAASTDIQEKIDNKDRMTIDELEIVLNEKCPRVMPVIWKLVENFKFTFIRGTVAPEIWNLIKKTMPNLREELLESGFCANYDTNINARESKEKHKRNSDQVYYSFGDIGFSFGSNIALLGWIHSLNLGVNKNKLILYSLPKDLSTFPELVEWCKAWEDNIDVRPILEHGFTNEELRKINRNKTRSYRTESLSLLRKELSI